jgi:hypothetical protein
MKLSRLHIDQQHQKTRYKATTSIVGRFGVIVLKT